MEDEPELRFPQRYTDLGRIGRGGWGEIRRIHDRELDRTAVAKVLSWKHLESATVRARFLNEARITASLDHPGVVPVIDGGTLPDGRPWFAMKEVQGRTLRELLDDPIGATDLATRLRRLVEIVLRVAESVAYAHERGIVHRDLKPGNVMVGRFGEVFVLDWGVARTVGEPARPDLSPSELDDPGLTMAGEILGTVSYMAPEQARGARDQVGPAADVYALGLILFELVTGQRARDGDRVAMWVQASLGDLPHLESGPPELRALISESTRVDPAERQPDALGFASALRAWLDGAARRKRAERAVADAAYLSEGILAIQGQRDSARAALLLARADVRDHDPVEKKRPIWELEDRVARIDVELAMVEERRIELLRSALEHDTDHAPAHAELARIYRAKLAKADRSRSPIDAARWELLLRKHDRGEHASFLRGTGRVVLDTRPPVEVVARRVAIEGRRLVPGEPSSLGRTPIDAELQAGSYLLELRFAEREARYPIVIGRDEVWDIRRPGSAAAEAISPPAELGKDDVFVPAGWALVGHDDLAAEPVPSRRVWVDAFVIGRHPVTCREYLAFLDDLAARDETLAMRYAPALARATGAGPAVIRIHGRFEMAPDENGRSIDLDYPIASIDWHGARAYARWLAARTGLPWRLPNELEWEKAARGVDARAFPWGDQPEPTWACVLGTRSSTDDPPRREAIASYPEDESPYGVRGMAGNVRDWCMNEWRVDGPPIVGDIVQLDEAGEEPSGPITIRGGGWTSPITLSRSASRFAAKADEWFINVGIRLVRSV